MLNLSDPPGVGDIPWRQYRWKTLDRWIPQIDSESNKNPVERSRHQNAEQCWTCQMDGSSDEPLNYDSPENARTVVIVLWRRAPDVRLESPVRCACRLSASSVFGEERCGGVRHEVGDERSPGENES